MEAKIIAEAGVFMGKWERECLVLLWERMRQRFDGVLSRKRGERKRGLLGGWTLEES